MLADPDARLVAACLGPVRLPRGQLVQKDVERLWISDRKALIQCGRLHRALRDFYHHRDAQLRSRKK
ncbi:anaerobic dehydrogenase [Mesorhizobium sp. B2-5-7]|nr:anaerobic dehydrogenase [Mesorhizobium sp. B2-5-7]